MLAGKPLVRYAAASLIFLGAVACSGPAFAYRPFDSTDAAVADVNELEIEYGPAGYRQSRNEHTLVAPAYVVNYGFTKDWELVLEGRGEHPMAATDDLPSRLVGNALFLKGVLREGVLQGKSGPSFATEFGVLLPGLHDEQSFGASWIGIVSQRWSWGTMNFNLGGELTHEHNANLIVGTIIVDALSESDAILASNSSSYSSSAFADSVKNPARLLNTHFLMPPGITPVELMSCGQTDPVVIQLLVDVLPGYGLTPYVVQRESMGFIFNRIWAAIKRETLAVAAEGVASAEVVDAIYNQATGSQPGPFRLMDALGLDVVLSIE